MLLGRLGKPAMGLLNKLVKCALAGGVVSKDGFVVSALREISVCLCRGNCVLYTRIFNALACVSGNAPRGADIPTSKSIKDVFFSFKLMVFQSLLGAVLLLHSML